MIHEVEVNSWEEFEEAIRKIRSDTQGSSSGLQFRGQADYAWSLETTLERRSKKSYSLLDFYRTICRIRPEVESFTSANWNISSREDIEAWCNNFDNFGSAMPAYEFISHLRHNGFPSPLLDWTNSPYVAAYFAFAQAKTCHAAIYVFCEKPDFLKGYASNRPRITRLGKFVKTHVRHFRQQSTYTVCTNFEGNTGRFVPHQTVFELSNEDQDVLWKIKIPVRERLKILKILDEYNLNEYSLFGSEESLMQTLAFREIDLNHTEL